MSEKELKIIATIDTSEVVAELERMKKLTKPKYKVRFEIKNIGLKFNIKKIKKWQFWKRHNIKIEICHMDRWDSLIADWKILVNNFENNVKK